MEKIAFGCAEYSKKRERCQEKKAIRQVPSYGESIEAHRGKPINM